MPPTTSQIDSTARISRVRLQVQGADPVVPAAGYGYLYPKADGVYFEDDAGNVTGPFIDSSGVMFADDQAAAFGDATPSDFFVVPSGLLVQEVRVFVTQTWDGGGAGIKIGTTIDDDAFFAASEIELTDLASFQKSFNTPGPITLRLTITPGGGASQGQIEIQTVLIPS